MWYVQAIFYTDTTRWKSEKQNKLDKYGFQGNSTFIQLYQKQNEKKNKMIRVTKPRFETGFGEKNNLVDFLDTIID